MDYSRITDDLFIGTTPTVPDYEHLRELGVRLVINMRWEFRPPPDSFEPPLTFLWQRTFDSPVIPIPMQALHRGARAALETIGAGGKVYVHCAAGRHRGVAMGSCVLIAQGYDAHTAMKLVMERRRVADPHIFYIRNRILRFAREWNGGL
ncbi:MAG TPA: dual specificity protein phosphatase [Anaerolineales bacterium]|nr:dual specificity protein phosphatase [Anaerolineales bacterium]